MPKWWKLCHWSWLILLNMFYWKFTTSVFWQNNKNIKHVCRFFFPKVTRSKIHRLTGMIQLFNKVCDVCFKHFFFLKSVISLPHPFCCRSHQQHSGESLWQPAGGHSRRSYVWGCYGNCFFWNYHYAFVYMHWHHWRYSQYHFHSYLLCISYVNMDIYFLHMNIPVGSHMDYPMLWHLWSQIMVVRWRFLENARWI